LLSSSPRLLFRREDDCALPSAYLTASFLNESVVLASDDYGRIDAVRIPINNNPEVSTGNGFIKGTLLSRMDPCPLVRRPSMKPLSKLMPLDNGNAFAVGMINGELRVFATEHELTWNTKGVRKTTSGSDKMIPLFCAVQSSGIRRRFHRSDAHGSKLCHQVQKTNKVARPSRSSNSGRQPTEIIDWNSGLFPPLRSKRSCSTPTPAPQIYIPNEAESVWDVSESSNNILAVNVDQESDCFSLRCLDNRAAGSKGKTVLGVDLNDGDKRFVEDITSVCFSGNQYQIVTGHVFQSLAGVGLDKLTGTNTRRPFQNMLKVWDMRKLTCGKSLNCLDRISVFPNTDVCGILQEASCSIVSNSHTKALFSDVSISSNSSASPSKDLGSSPKDLYSNQFLSQLQASEDGSLLRMSLQHYEQTTRTEVLINTVSAVSVSSSVSTHAVRSSVTVPSRNTFIPKTSCLSYNFDYMACCGTTTPLRDVAHNNTHETCIHLYDLTNPSGTTNACHHDQDIHLKRDAYPTRSGRKRRNSATSNTNNNNIPNVYSANKNSCQKATGVLYANKLLDQYDLESDLTCMAMSRYGTRLVCGTSDGDLYAWGT